MKRRCCRQPGASSLVITLVTLAALSLMAAYTFVRVLPRVRMAYQNAAWQEARVAAEAGIDIAMNDLQVNASGGGNPWAGWKTESGAAPGSILSLPGLLNGLLTSPLSTVTGLLGSLLGGGGSPAPSEYAVSSTAPVYLDNLKLSASGIPSEIDVRLWGLSRPSAPHRQWFRIRSTATCALPPRALEVPANLDALLRRFSLRTVRNSLKKEQAGAPSSIGLPNVTRTVEALVEPILPFELAVWSGDTIILGSTGLWNIDSFDSSDDAKSAGGLYPGRGSAKVQSNGSVANSQPRPYDAPYGPLIAANGTRIQGAVATNGGDDPDSVVHENVTGAAGLDLSRVRDDFTREMPPVARPSVTAPQSAPTPGAAFVAGSTAAPSIYAVPGSLTQIKIVRSAGQATGAIVIMIDGSVDLAGPLIVPPGVRAVLYVRGNIAFRETVNSGPWSSNRAGQLLIFGDAQKPMRQTVQTFGEISVTAAFYGPQADVTLDGNSTWVGSVAASTIRVSPGGDGGLHYDEALALLGPPISFRISRYIEDVRE